MNHKLVLAEGTHAHVLKSAQPVVKKKITIKGDAPLSNFLYQTTVDSVINHEVPVKGHSQVREPHGAVAVPAGVHENIIAREYNPFTERNMEMYD